MPAHAPVNCARPCSDQISRLAVLKRIVPFRGEYHVVNVPSPAATASLLIGGEVLRMAEELGGLRSLVEVHRPDC